MRPKRRDLASSARLANTDQDLALGHGGLEESLHFVVLCFPSW